MQDRDDERQEQGLLHVAPLPGPVRRDRPGPQAGQPPQAVSGEVRDDGVRVHNQYLSVCRYAKLNKLWLNHGIPEEVTHNLEQSPSMEQGLIILTCLFNEPFLISRSGGN